MIKCSLIKFLILLTLTQHSLASEASEVQVQAEPTFQELADEILENFDRKMLFLMAKFRRNYMLLARSVRIVSEG